MSYRQKGSALRFYVGWTFYSLFDQSPVKRSRNTKSEAICHIHPYAMIRMPCFHIMKRTSGTDPFILRDVFVITFLCFFWLFIWVIMRLGCTEPMRGSKMKLTICSRHSFQESPEFISRPKAKPKRNQKRSLIQKKMSFYTTWPTPCLLWTKYERIIYIIRRLKINEITIVFQKQIYGICCDIQFSFGNIC